MGMICACSMHCPISGYHERACCDKTACDCWCHEKPAPRGSVMPAHMQPIDTLFLDGVREYAPDEWAIGEKDLSTRARREGAV